MNTFKKFQKATEGSAPCDLFDDLSPITIVLNRIVVWIANRLKGHISTKNGIGVHITKRKGR